MQGRFLSQQFDDDQNTLPLSGYFTVDAELSRAISPHVSSFIAAQNVTASRYDIGRTPVLTVGPRALVRAGARIFFH